MLGLELRSSEEQPVLLTEKLHIFSLLGEEAVHQDRKLDERASCPTPKPSESLGGTPSQEVVKKERGGPTGRAKPELNTHPEFCFRPVLQPHSRLGLFLLKRRTPPLPCPMSSSTHSLPWITSSQCVALDLGMSRRVYCK